jgi:hypothetical protein
MVRGQLVVLWIQLGSGVSTLKSELSRNVSTGQTSPALYEAQEWTASKGGPNKLCSLQVAVNQGGIEEIADSYR